MNQTIEEYKKLMQSLLNREISASNFEKQFLNKFKNEKNDLGANGFYVLDWVFADVDAYVSDITLYEPEKGDINEDKLRERLVWAIDRLDNPQPVPELTPTNFNFMQSSKSKVAPSMLRDPSFWGIIIGNAFTLFMALNQHWTMMPLIWIYFGQNVIIGITNYVRMRAIEPKDKFMPLAGFFAQHYGFFHGLYFLFLLIFTFAPEKDFAPGLYEKVAMTDNDALWIWLCVGSFAIVPFYNLIRYRGRDFGKNPPSADTLFMYPYLRVVPMHLTLLFAFVVDNALIYFMIIKTIADLGMEMVEYRMFRRSPERLEMKD